LISPRRFVRAAGLERGHDGGCRGRLLRPQGEGIGFQGQKLTARATYLVFVQRAFTDTGNEDFPDAGAGMEAHLVAPAVPVIEVADHTDAASVGRPHGEDDTFDPIDDAPMCAELAVEIEMVALRHEVKIDRTERRRKAIGILDLGNARLTGDAEAVGKRCVRAYPRDEESISVDALHSGDDTSKMRVDQLHAFRLRQKSPDHHAVVVLMHAEEAEGVLVVGLDDGADLAAVLQCRKFVPGHGGHGSRSGRSCAPPLWQKCRKCSIVPCSWRH
jgi:hypothetical protein